MKTHRFGCPRGLRRFVPANGWLRACRGFSLVELLVAISIMVILSGVVGVVFLREPGRARQAAARAQIERFRVALQLYANDNGMLPTERQGLDALVRKPTVPPVPLNYPEWGGYLDARDIPLDPWGNPYDYRVPGRGGEPYEIISYGRDGQPGGDGEDAEISSASF